MTFSEADFMNFGDRARKAQQAINDLGAGPPGTGPTAVSCTVTVRAKGQITLPLTVQYALGIGPGDFVQFEPQPDGTVKLTGARLRPVESRDVLDGLKEAGAIRR